MRSSRHRDPDFSEYCSLFFFPFSFLLKVEQVRLCEECGEEGGPDPYCDLCAGNVIEVEIEEKSFRKMSEVGAALSKQTAQNKHSDEEEDTLRVCSDCGEEAGKERFCTVCGGDVIGERNKSCCEDLF